MSPTRTFVSTPTPSPTFARPAACALDEPGPFPSSFPSVPPLGGGSEITPPTYGEVQLVEPGVSISHELSPEEEERVLDAVDGVRAALPANGVEIGCIRIFTSSQSHDDYAQICGGGKLGEFRDFEGFTFGYLPPGTYASSPQYAAICPDGSVSGFGLEFSTGSGVYTIWFAAGNRALLVGGIGRAYTANLGERSSVIVLGSSVGRLRRHWIGMATDGGVIIIDGHGLPLDEAVNIAIGTCCQMC